MKIREIQLKNFKCFTETKICEIPPTTRLVLLVGPNGCGKSSIIDAVNMWHRHKVRMGNWDDTYHRKQIPGITASWNESVVINFHDPQPSNDDQLQKSIYIRTAYRNDPEFELGEIRHVGHAVNEFRINRLIDNDKAVSLNYQRLVSNAFEDVFEKESPSITIGQFREKVIGDIKSSMERLFPGLILNSLGNPLSSGTFKFDKGESKSFLYKNLSGGEKAAFDLILDIHIKKNEFNDTIFFIDEPEAHMTPALQGALLNELINIIPVRSQLWLSSHSISMMRQAQVIESHNPGSVSFIDFDGLSFDIPQTLEPVQPNKAFWKRAMQIALYDLAGYVTPERVVLCEGGSLNSRSDFDAECYNEIFQNQYPNVIFIGAGSADDIQRDPRGLSRLIGALAPDVHITRVIDRDDRTDEEIRGLKNRSICVLSLRTIESYLLDDSVLIKFCESKGHPELIGQLLQEKKMALQNSIAHGGPTDDLKRPSGDIYNSTKRLFQNQKLGGDTRAFLKGICARLITPEMPIYNSLRSDIFNE